MARRKSVAELTEMLARARAREAARLAARSTNTAYETRGPQTEALYRSMLRKSGNSRAVYKVSVDSGTVKDPGEGQSGGILTVAQAGLLAENASLSGGDVLVGPIKGTGVKPTRLSWYFGQTPVGVPANAQHGRYIKRWKEDSGGQSHRSTPFSITSGVVDSTTLTAAFNTILQVGAFRTALGAGGKATLIFEEGYLTGD